MPHLNDRDTSVLPTATKHYISKSTIYAISPGPPKPGTDVKDCYLLKLKLIHDIRQIRSGKLPVGDSVLLIELLILFCYNHQRFIVSTRMINYSLWSTA